MLSLIYLGVGERKDGQQLLLNYGVFGEEFDPSLTLPPWHNRRGQWAECPLKLFTVKFLLTNREKRGKDKRENGEEKKEKCKREGKKIKMEGEKVSENEQRTLVCCFLKPVKFVWGLPKWEKIGKCGPPHRKK